MRVKLTLTLLKCIYYGTGVAIVRNLVSDINTAIDDVFSDAANTSGRCNETRGASSVWGYLLVCLIAYVLFLGIGVCFYD